MTRRRPRLEDDCRDETEVRGVRVPAVSENFRARVCNVRGRYPAGTRVSRDEKETGRTREKERDTEMERRAEEKREVSMPGVTIGLPPTATRYALPGDGVGVLGLRPLDAISSLPVRSIRQRTFKPST